MCHRLGSAPAIENCLDQNSPVTSVNRNGPFLGPALATIKASYQTIIYDQREMHGDDEKHRNVAIYLGKRHA